MQRCLGCMRGFGEAYDVCPHCGYIVGTQAASKNHLAPGTVLQNRYTLGKALGQGGFGVTYIAWDNRIGRAVAIKEYMPGAFASRAPGEKEISCYNAQAREQFASGVAKTRKEAHALSRFGKLESVVKVYDCVEENGTAYIVMELLRGKTVKETVAQNGPLSLAQTVRIMTPVLETLDAMHAAGILHRDVSPDNIFVCEDGKVKLLDFGAARIIGSSDEKTLSIILKHGYAPVEQYSSKMRQDTYTDVYSACATMYKMLTGKTPPDSLSRSESGTDAALFRHADIPDPVREAIAHGMAVLSRERTQTVRQLLSELKREQPAHRGGRAPTHAVRIAAGVLAAAAAVFIVVLLRAVTPSAAFVSQETTSHRAQPSSAAQTQVTAAVRQNGASVGDVIPFGAYEQDNNASNGKETIEWIVLDVQNDRMLVVSKYALDAMPYDETDADAVWETCTLRTWLNGTFLQDAFSETERKRIVPETVTADANPSYHTDAGGETTDTIFLLSLAQADRYFPSTRSRKCAPSAQATAHGAWTSGSYTTVDGAAVCWWWLRSPGGSSGYAASVDYFGTANYFGHRVGHSDGAVRPAMWLAP